MDVTSGLSHSHPPQVGAYPCHQKKRNAGCAFRLAVREDAGIPHRPDERVDVLVAQIVLADICAAM